MPPHKDMAKEAKEAKRSKSKKKHTHSKKSTKELASNLSAEFVEDSSDEDEAEKPVDNPSSKDQLPVKATPVSSKVNGKVATTIESKSSDEESSEGSEDGEPSASAKTTSIAPVPASQATRESNVKTVSFKPAAATPYQPPTGFEAKAIDAETKSSQLFKKSNTKGKQIWYFTAPASIPLSSIEKISLRDIEKGKKVLSHNGNDYSFMQDPAQVKTYSKILTPNSSDEGYRTVTKSVDQILHLQQIVQLPGLSNGTISASPLATVPAPKPIRQQPSGLRMRFRPIGFGEGKTGDIGSRSPSADDDTSNEDESDQEMPDAPLSNKVSSADEGSSSDSESSADGSSDEEMTDLPPTASKKVSKPTPVTETPITPGGTLKRKHSVGGDSKAKNSSSQSTITTDQKQLKKIKTKQTESQKLLADSRSVSNEHTKTSAILPPPRLGLSASPMPPSSTPQPGKPNTAILPPRFGTKSTPIRPSTQNLPPGASQPSANSSSPVRLALETPSRDSKPRLSLEEQIAAIDPNLSPEKHDQEVKRLKRNETSRLSKAKRRSLAKNGVESEAAPVSAPLQNVASISASASKATPIPVPSKVTPIPVPSHKATPVSVLALSQKVSSVATPPQKVTPVPVPSSKVNPSPAPSQYSNNKPIATDAPVQAKEATPPMEETKAERKARKEAKRLKKEAKKAAEDAGVPVKEATPPTEEETKAERKARKEAKKAAEESQVQVTQSSEERKETKAERKARKAAKRAAAASD